VWPDASDLASPRAADAVPLGQLAADLKRQGVRPRVRPDGRDAAAVRVRRSPGIEHPDGYRLDISPDDIQVTASTDAGAYYGVQTLRDLVAAHGRELPCCRIDDWPDFPRRAVYHDTARGKVPTLDTLKGLIERLAHWKINELQLYVENGFAFVKHPQIGRGFSPLTPADVHELQAHCRAHHVRFVGSLASFGHMELVLRLSEFRGLGELPGHHGYPGGTTLCPVDPGSIKLVRELYDEFVPLFDAVDFNACGDEPWELGEGRSRRRVANHGKGRVYLDFMKRVDDICRSHGKRTNLWADIVLDHPELLPDWPGDIVMLNWAYDASYSRLKRTGELAKAGLPFMVCPGTNGWASHGSRLPMAIDNVAAFSTEAREHGAEGVLHTDWGDGGHRNTLAVSLCSFAHAAAHAWHGRAVHDAGFVRRFARHHLGQTDGRLAEAIETLGGVCDHVGHRNALYYSLREPIVGRRRKRLLRVGHGWTRMNSAFDTLDPRKLDEAMAMLSPLCEASAWPTPPKHADAFDRLTLKEYRLAAMQDHAACHRCRLAHRHRAGGSVASAEWRALDDELGELGDTFDRLWLKRNRPSRLKENRFILDAARGECRALA